MKCPVCARDLAPTLSICMTCGAMRNDTVREELQTKITSGPLSRNKVAAPPSVEKAIEPVPAPKAETALPKPLEIAERTQETGPGGPTSGLRQPAKTSPTLVGFQSKQAAIPEWRLQMQNAVRQRMGIATAEAVATVATAPAPVRTASPAARTAPARKPLAAAVPQDADPRLAAALGRIQASRHAFSTQAAEPIAPRRTPAQKNVQFNVVPPTRPAVAPRKLPEPEFYTPMPKPFEAPMRIKLDTNKLPKLSEVIPQSDVPVEIFDEPVEEQAEPSTSQVTTATVNRFVINAEANEAEDDIDEMDADDLEDLAPFSMRVNAGLFDLIIGIVATMVIMSPFVFAGGDWLSLSGGLLFAGALAVVLFLYTTFSIAFVGKTLGMRLFSLEVVDVDENEYPTMQQAAVSSSVFLLSLMFAGVGFLPMLFNPERRAAHDLASGTIVVREF